MAQTVKNLPTMRETWVQSLGWEDPLEKAKATHSSILAWRILQARVLEWGAIAFSILGRREAIFDLSHFVS